MVANDMTYIPFFRAAGSRSGASSLPKLLVVLVLLLSALGGCQKAVLTPPGEGPRTPVAISADAPLADKAFAAYMQGDYRLASTLYDRLLQEPGLSRRETVEAWKYFALSNIAYGKHHLGLEALEKWRSLDPEAQTGAEWLNAYNRAMTGMSGTGAARTLEGTVQDDQRPWAVRAESALLLARMQWEGGDKASNAAALQALETLYAQTSAPADAGLRATLESRLYTLLQETDENALARLAGHLTAENELRYPYSIILLEKARRTATDSADWPPAWQAMQRLRHTDTFADRLLLDRVLMPLEQEFGRPSQGIALALPLTGPFGNIGWKILRGAGVAQWELARQGNDLSVTVINTAAAGWEQRLESLPEGVSIVGGPLQKETYTTMQRTGLLRQRAFFTFLTSLNEGEEGRIAWRFFSSPRDQIRSLLDFAQQDLEIAQYGILAPDEPFGAHMAQMFRQTASEMGASTTVSATYAPKDTLTWSKVLQTFLRVPAQRAGEDTPMPPNPPFQAVFLPDGWQQMQALLPHFFYYQEDRMVFLGNALWEQGLSGSSDTETRYLNLAVFPGSWNPYAPTAAAMSLAGALDESGLGKPDLWVGLGYDFVRFASMLGTPEKGEGASAMNARIQSAQQMDWSIAPIRWTADGLAAQKMFLFTPAARGFTPIDPAQFKERLENTRTRHADRVKMLEEARQQKRQ